MKKFSIRKATVNDINQLTKMRIAYLKEDLGENSIKDENDFKDELSKFLRKHLNKDIDAFVLVIDGEIISTSFTAYYYRLPHPKFPSGKAGVPINGYTKPEFRKQGFASALLKFSAEYAKKNGVELLNMEVTKSGLITSKKIGFNVINYIPVQLILTEK